MKMSLFSYIPRLFSQKKVLITIAADSWSNIEQWGDYYIALMLKNQLKEKGFHPTIDLYNSDSILKRKWYLSIHIRGLHSLSKKVQSKIKVIWLVSHPEMVNFQELNSYDYIFIASEFYLKKYKNYLTKPSYYLPQFSDSSVFYYEYDPTISTDVLFVGNSRGVMRPSVRYLLKSKYKFQIWGYGWEKFVKPNYISHKILQNKELHKYYASAKVVLNDHWSDMKKFGFLNNRFYDISLSKGLCINDNIHGFKKNNSEGLIRYRSDRELGMLINLYIDNPDLRTKAINKAYNHTIKHNTVQIITNRLTKLLNLNL